MRSALEPLGVAVCLGEPPTYGKALLCLYQAEEKPAHLHLAFRAGIASKPKLSVRAALEGGGRDNGAPGLRAHYHASYHAVSSLVRTAQSRSGLPRTWGLAFRRGDVGEQANLRPGPVMRQRPCRVRHCDH